MLKKRKIFYNYPTITVIQYSNNPLKLIKKRSEIDCVSFINFGASVKRHHFYFLLLFTLLAGCSGQRGSVRLNITKSFVTANAGFSGGLYLHGKNASTGEEFSFTLASETSSSVQLKFGTWDIRVVGWENGAQYFEGNVLCGLEKIDFKSDNQSANIQITNPKCKDSAFTNLSFINEANGIVSFKPIPVYTCGALYDITDATKLKTPTTLTPNFCQTYPKAFQKKAKGMKIGLHNQLIGGSIEDGITSNCIPSMVTASNESFQNAKLLPTKIPMTISFFEDDICSTAALAGKYYFPDGLEHTRSREQIGFDAVLSSGDLPMLAVASTLSKRGTTPFVNEIPTFYCGPTNSVSCLTLPPRGSADFVLSQGWNVVLLPPTSAIQSCESLQFESSFESGSQDIKLVNCIYENRQAKLHLDVNYTLSINSSNANTNGPTCDPYQYCFLVNGQTYKVQRFDHLRIYKDLQRILGKNESITPDISNSLVEDGNEGRSNEGIFEELADILSPDKAGGLFWDQPCSSTPLPSPITRNVSFQEDGKIANYTLTLTNSPSGTLPTYISSETLYPILPSSLNRRIIIREFTDLIGYKTRMVLDLACVGLNVFNGARIGKLEKQSQESDGSREHTHKSLMFWNTSLNNQARFEKYEINMDKDSSSSTQPRNYQNSSFIRGEKLSGTTTSDIKITQIDHNFHFDDNMTPSVPSDDSNHESVGFKEYDIRGTKIKQTQHAGLHYKSSTAGEIFNKRMYAEELERIRFGINKPNDFIFTHPNGNYISHNHLGNSFASEIRAFNGSESWTNYLAVAPKLVSGDFSLDGSRAIVATIYEGVPGLTIYFYDSTNNMLSSHSLAIANQVITSPFISDISDIKTSILDSGEFIISISRYSNGTPTHYYAKMNVTSIPPSIIFQPLFTSGSNSIGQLALTNDSSNFSLTLFENITLEQTLGTTATTFLINKNGIILSQTPETNFSGSSFLMNTLMITMNNLIVYPADFDITVPYVRPIIPGFEMNLMSVNPLFMEQNVFTNKATFEGL